VLLILCSLYQSAARGGRVELDERCSLAEALGAEQAEIESLDYFRSLFDKIVK